MSLIYFMVSCGLRQLEHLPGIVPKDYVNDIFVLRLFYY